MQTARKTKSVLKNEVRFLKDLVTRLLTLVGASKYEMERLLKEGGKESENTAILREDYTDLLTMLGIESIDPNEGIKAEEAKSE